MKYIFLLLATISLNAKPQPEPVVVLGGGIGGSTAALYLARAGLQPLVLDGATPGGLLTQSHSIQNWPGVPDIDGFSLTDQVRQQAASAGARFSSEEVVSVDFSHRPFQIETRSLDGKKTVRKIAAQTCIIAMGTQPNFLGIPGESTYWGNGVSNCATCDGSFYKNRIVGVVGGGDAAVIEALYLSKIAKQVHIFVRKDRFRAVEKQRLDALLASPNVQVHYNTEVKGIVGDGTQLTSVVLQNQKHFPLDGLFLGIGSTPNSALFQGILELDARGYILLKHDQETSTPGVYAVGDIVDPVYKQAISASADGAKAALQAQRYLADHKLSKTGGLGATALEESALPTVIEVTSVEQLKQELQNSDVPIIVDFYAHWCGPCKRISPMLDLAAKELNGKVKFLKVNVDELSALGQTYQIRAMPTVLMFDTSGAIVERKVGLDQIADLLQQIAQE
jgi:thioredoxin reductase (NADPH)